MKALLQSLGMLLLFLDTAYMYVLGLVVASFRGDQIVAAYTFQFGPFVLVALLIAAVVAAASTSRCGHGWCPMQDWLPLCSWRSLSAGTSSMPENAPPT